MSGLRFIDEFRDPQLAKGLAAAIAAEAEPARDYRMMEFCGGHTHAIMRHGVQRLMPPNVRFTHGPGCPVCVLPGARIDAAIHLGEAHGAILCGYGDLLRVPGASRRSLLQARAAGADVRMLYSPEEALAIARDNPDQEVVFIAIGFETTTPPTAAVVQQARRERLGNFSVLCNHVLTPAAMRAILNDGDTAVDAILGPSHVSAIIGLAPYRPIVEQYRRPLVVAGFEPLDVMQATLMAIRQVNAGRAEVENQYTRVVDEAGNSRAQALMEKVFTLRERFEWRGLGWLPQSALCLRDEYAEFDAERRFELPSFESHEPNSCECPAILSGKKQPQDCRLFGKGCTPDSPLGACMVSSEGACAAAWSYGR